MKWKEILKSARDWVWIERLFDWVLMSGGKISSILFLVAGIWLSVLYSVKGFIPNNDLTRTITFLSKTAFTALPEVILFLSALNTLDQIRMIRATQKGTIEYKLAWTWTFLFGIPTTGFIGYALFNIGGSLLQSDYEMPPWIIVARGLTCFIYALLVFIFNERLRPCFATRIHDIETEYGSMLTVLSDHIDTQKTAHENQTRVLYKEIDDLKEDFEREIFTLSEQLKLQNQTVLKLSERASSLELQGLEGYPNVINDWVKNKLLTVSLEKIITDTGHSKRRILSAKLRTSPRNRDLYIVSSVIEWLGKTPSPFPVITIENTEL